MVASGWLITSCRQRGSPMGSTSITRWSRTPAAKAGALIGTAISGEPPGRAAIEQLTDAPADDRRRRPDHAAERLPEQLRRGAGRRVAQMRVHQGNLGRAPATLEIAQSVVVQIAFAKVQPAKPVSRSPLDGRPHHQVVGPEIPIARIRSTELVDQGAIPGQK